MTTAVPSVRAFSDAALGADTEEQLVEAFLVVARELIGVDQVHLIEVSQDEAVGHARVVAYEADSRREDAYVMVFDERPSGAMTCVQTRRPVLVSDARVATIIRSDFNERFAPSSLLFLPVMWNGVVRWVVNLLRSRGEPFTDADVEIGQLLANLTAAGLALVEGREPGRDQEAALARAARALNLGGDQNDVLTAMTREADIAVGGSIAGVYLGDGINGGRGTAGHNSPPEWFGYVIRPGEGVGGQVLATGLPVIANSYQQDVRVPDSRVLSGLQTAVAVPITVAGEVRGALSIGFEDMRRITRRDLTTLEAFADLAAVALR